MWKLTGARRFGILKGMIITGVWNRMSVEVEDESENRNRVRVPEIEILGEKEMQR